MGESIAPNTLVRLISKIVDGLNLNSLLSTYRLEGCPAYHPRMMLKLLFYAYMNNIYSCRRMEREAAQNIHYMWLSGRQYPSFSTINRFRSERHKHNLERKIQGVLSLIEQGIAQDNAPSPDDDPAPFSVKDLQDAIATINQRASQMPTSTKEERAEQPSKLARYRAEYCSTQCPLRGLCTKARYGAKVITVNHELNRLKEQARANLLSPEGRRQRGQRCIEPEAVFGQIKFNKGYTRFRHYTKDKVNMDFGLFAIAFNLQKYARKIAI